MIEVTKIKTEWRAVQFDASAGSDSFDDVLALFDWSRARGYINSLKDWMPSIDVPEKTPQYPGETRSVYVKHGDWIVGSSRGTVKVLTDYEYNEKFKEKS